MNLSVEPLCDALGAEIRGVDLRKLLSPEDRDRILEAFHEYVLLLFRGQNLTSQEQTRFARTFGDLGKRTVGPRFQTSPDDAYADPVMLVTNRSDEGPKGGVASFGDGEMWFHHDTCFYEIPNIVTMLYGIEVTSRGGHTKIASMYRAYERIPEALKAKLEGRKVLQVYDYQRHRLAPGADLSKARQHVQPIFIKHPATGKKALYVNRMMTASIEGMEREESDAILQQLFDLSEKESLIYEHTWRVGDLLMWDNRCSIHARTDFPNEERRILRRCTVAGKETMRA